MKKFIALLLSLAMILSLCSLTACGKRGGDDNKDKDGSTDAKYTLMKMQYAPSLDAALRSARYGGSKTVTVIPNGISVIVTN